MKKIISLSISLSLLMIPTSYVLAQSTSPRAGETRNEVKQNVTDNRISQIKEKADAEIARRIQSLNDGIAKIKALKKLSDTQKSDFGNSINTQITALNSLKTKIDADSDSATLRADQKAIFDEYRIYMLYIPQTRILVEGDRLQATIDLMSEVSTKLAGRINGNVTLQAKLDDANAKITDARSQITNAVNLVTGLTPDNGDAGKAASNKTALQNARQDLVMALKDINTARQDFQQIVNALKSSLTPTP